MTGASGVVESSEDASEPDYSAVEISSEDRTEYSYVERRAELLQLVREAGHPRALNQTQLADRYGVSQQQISKDFDRLSTHIRETVVADRQRRAFTVDTVTQRAIRGLLDEGEWRQAAKTAVERADWFREFHDFEELAERIERLEAQQQGASDPMEDLS